MTVDPFEELLAQRLRGRSVAVPARVDAQIMEQFRRAQAPRGPRRLPLLLGLGGCAAAAAAALLWLWPPDPYTGPNVLDAFQLARRLEQGEVLDAAYDFDGDGRVSRRDVQQLLQLVVRLEEPPR